MREILELVESVQLNERSNRAKLVTLLTRYSDAESKEERASIAGNDAMSIRQSKRLERINNNFWSILELEIPPENMPEPKDRKINLYGDEYQFNPEEWLDGWYTGE